MNNTQPICAIGHILSSSRRTGQAIQLADGGRSPTRIFAQPCAYDSPLHFLTSSKWHLFARELILHIESELYTDVMTTDQVDFVEKHTDEIVEVQKLMLAYRTFVQHELQSTLEETFPGLSFQVREEVWPGHVFAFRFSAQTWNGNDGVVFRGERGEKVRATVFLANICEPRLTEAKSILDPLWAYDLADNDYPSWTSRIGCGTATGAIQELCSFLRVAEPVLREPG